MVKKIVNGVVWLLIERLGKILAAIFIGGLMARQLGVEGYGDFQYALAIVLMFASVGLICGGEVIVPRMINASPEKIEKLMGNAFVLRISFSTIAYIVMMSYVLGTQGLSETTLLVGILGMMVFFREPFGVIIAWLQSKTKNKSYAFLGLCAVIVKLLFVYILYKFDLGSKTLFAALWLLEAILVAIGLLLVYQRANNGLFFNFSLSGIIPLFKAGVPIWFGLIAMYVFLRVDRIFLKEYSGLSELGIYSAVMQISENMTMVATTIASTAAPFLIYQEVNTDKMRANVLKLALGMFIIAIISAVVGTLISPWIILILFGNEFEGASSMLGYALFSGSLVFIEAALNTYLLKSLGGKQVLFKWLAVMIVGTFIDYLTIPIWGGYGALMGFAAGYIVAITLGCYWIFNNTIRV